MEFKYHTSRLKVDPDKFQFLTELKEQAATDVLRFGFRKDVYRLEQLKIKENIASGACILLTNNPNIINSRVFKNQMSAPYVFFDKLHKEDPGWDHSFIKREGEALENYWKTYAKHNYILPLQKDYDILTETYTPTGIEKSEKNSLFKYYIVNI